MQAVSLSTTPEFLDFFKTKSPTLNGTYPLTNTSFTPYFEKCFNGYIDPMVKNYNNNGTTILQSCVLDAACQQADTVGCSAVCGKVGFDTHLLTIISNLDEKQENRQFAVTVWDAFAAKVATTVKVLKSIKTDSFSMHRDDKLSYKSDLSQEDPKNDVEKKKLEDALNEFNTHVKNTKPGATPQEGWSIGTGLALVGAAGVGGAIVYGAQKVREKEQQNTTDAKSNRLPLSKFSKV